MAEHRPLTGLYGLMAQFATPEALLAAAARARDAGYRNMDAFTPFPVEELPEALGTRHTRLPWLILFGAIAGGVGAYLLQYWTVVVDYPLNVGGRPMHSWPAFIVVTFEACILGAALTAVFGMILANRLPRPYHPVFNVDAFERATRDRFFLCIEAKDPRFDVAQTGGFLASLSPEAVYEVPR